jgi:hypothetical protein
MNITLSNRGPCCCLIVYIQDNGDEIVEFEADVDVNDSISTLSFKK